MNPVMIMEILNSGAADKFFNLFGKKKEESKQVVTDTVTEFADLKNEVKELHAKLDVILAHLGIELIKQEYIVKERKEGK